MNELSKLDSGGDEKPTRDKFLHDGSYLADHFETKWTEYQSGILDNFVPLIYSRSIDQLLIELLETVGGTQVRQLDLYNHSSQRQNLSAFLNPRRTVTYHHSWIVIPHMGCGMNTKTSSQRMGALRARLISQEPSESEKKGKTRENLGPNSIFYDFNEKGAQRSIDDSGSFFKILKSINLAGPRVQLKLVSNLPKNWVKEYLKSTTRVWVEMRNASFSSWVKFVVDETKTSTQISSFCCCFMPVMFQPSWQWEMKTKRWIMRLWKEFLRISISGRSIGIQPPVKKQRNGRLVHSQHWYSLPPRRWAFSAVLYPPYKMRTRLPCRSNFRWNPERGRNSSHSARFAFNCTSKGISPAIPWRKTSVFLLLIDQLQRFSWLI